MKCRGLFGFVYIKTVRFREKENKPRGKENGILLRILVKIKKLRYNLWLWAGFQRQTGPKESFVCR